MTGTDWPKLERIIRSSAERFLGETAAHITTDERFAIIDQIVDELVRRQDVFISEVGTPEDLGRLRSFVDLYTEGAVVGVGDLGVARIRGVAHARHLDDARVNNLIVSLMANDGAAYAALLEKAASLAEFDKLIVGRFSWRETKDRQQVGAVQHLLRQRIPQLLRQPPFSEFRIGGRNAYSLHADDRVVGPPTRAQVSDAVRRVARIPKVLSSPSSTRAPMYYTTPDLRRALVEIAEALDGTITLDDIRDVLDEVLAGMTPRIASDGEAALAVQAGSGASPEDEAIASDAAERALSCLVGEARTVAGLFLVGVARNSIARIIGRTEPTVDARRRAVEAALRTMLEDLPAEAREVSAESVVAILEREALATVCEWALRQDPFVATQSPSTTYFALGRAAPDCRPLSEDLAARGLAAVCAASGDGARIGDLDWVARMLETYAGAVEQAFTLDDVLAMMRNLFDDLDSKGPSDS